MTVLPAGYAKRLIYQMLVLARRYELNGKALILVISPLKSIFERSAVGDGIMESLGYPSADCSNFPVLFTNAN